MKSVIILLFSVCWVFRADAQKNDSLNVQRLRSVTIQGYRTSIFHVKELERVHQTYIVAGKKHEVISVQDQPANLSEKTGRQVFAKIPGVFVYDMDGSGNQVNIATRGLDPHRSWEYNVRQNGVMTNSDIYAYPASHYSPPLEAVSRIECIRGAASLQYGAQFGGMMNYVLKQPDTTEIIGFESLNSVGSFGLLSTYNAVGGKQGNFSYYAYYQKRVSDGYRDNARSDAQAQYIGVKYRFSPDLLVKAEIGRSQYVYQVPGPLTDAMFRENPRQATRSRNYFSPDIYVPSIALEWKINRTTALNWVNSAVLGDRSSVQFIGFADTPDTINSLSQQYKPRQVDIDRFHSYTSEIRLQKDYVTGKIHNTLVTGLRYIHNNLHRQQLGAGTTGTDFDLRLTTPQFGRDMRLKTQNMAFFAENLWRINPRLDLSAGVRIENGESRMSGVIAYLPNEKVPQDIIHKYPLWGFNGQYKLNNFNKIYGGWSQAYRPVVFSDMIPATPLEQTDPNLKDAFGYNTEWGVKGMLWQRLTYDVNFFQILYKNRVGSLVLTDANGASYVWRTNIGDSKTNGIELYMEYKIAEKTHYKISAFTASSFFDGFYLNGRLRNGSENVNLRGKRLETVPEWISRNGIQAAFKRFNGVLQYSYVSESYSDALNTVVPGANGARGLVPAYSVWDFNMTYRIGSHYIFKLGLNNLTNQQYFTKRPTGYPGQGVWSSDGRSLVASFGIRFGKKSS